MELEPVTHSERQAYQMPLTGTVELYGERPAVVWVPDAYGQMVPMRKDQAPAPMERLPPRDLTPGPLLDPVAQRIAATGMGAGAAGAGIGWGLGQTLAGIASFGVGGAAAVVMLLLIAARLGGGRTVVNNHTTVNNSNRWLGRSTTNTRQGRPS
jgi:hypothetical protein